MDEIDGEVRGCGGVWVTWDVLQVLEGSLPFCVQSSMHSKGSSRSKQELAVGMDEMDV